VSALLAAVSVGVVVLQGRFLVGIHAGGRPGGVVLGLLADPLTVTLVLLVCVVGALVQSFSRRYLRGDPAASRFSAAASLVVTGMVLVCASATLALLVAGWVLAGAAFLVALGCRPDLPGVATARRRSAVSFAVGDLALVIALAVVSARAGNVELATPGALAHATARVGGWETAVALLVVVAALTRSAQGPLGRWLPGTVSAPTPTSALLHAGVVNGGGILLVRLGVLAGSSLVAMVLALLVGGATAVVATQVMTRAPDVKGGLVSSTASQMGFMVAECAVGASLAAMVHVIGHALYKATLFLGSGGQVPRLGERPAAPVARASGLVRVGATSLAAVASAGAIVAVPGVLDHRGAAVLLVFAAGTAAAASWSWWERPPARRGGALGFAVGLVVAAGLYGALLAALGAWIGPSLPTTAASMPSPWWLLGVAVVGVGAAGLARLPGVRRRLDAILVDAAAAPVALLERGDRSVLVARGRGPERGRGAPVSPGGPGSPDRPGGPGGPGTPGGPYGPVLDAAVDWHAA
jgi:NADH:ubiquinone oxidoreductase subunit 5 (subunit L)/multisubunit Na+/H+ antiporter MnhA subunit